MNITIVCYRPNGCYEESRDECVTSDSEFSISYYSDIAEAARAVAAKLFANKVRPPEDFEWEITVLADGLDERGGETSLEERVCFRVAEASRPYLALLIAEREAEDAIRVEAERAKKEQERAARDQAAEKAERANYERLKAKFEGVVP